MARTRIVIVGSGFAGVWAAMGAAAKLERERAEDRVAVTLLSPEGALVIRPRLYEADLRGVRVPLEPLLSSIGVELRRASVETIDAGARRLALSGESPGGLAYDQLVLCAGSRLKLPRSSAPQHCVDGYAEARALAAAVAALADRPGAGFRVNVVGAGFTGIELAAELAGVMREAARSAGVPSPEEPVCLIDGATAVAPEFGPAARELIEAALTSLGVALRTGTAVSHAEHEGVRLSDGELVPGDLAVWACGPRASALTEQLGVPLDASGRAAVDHHLRAGADRVFIAGDCARASVDGTHIAPMSCQHAMPQGRQAGENAVAAALGRTLGRYRQPLYLTCLDLGAAGSLLTEGFSRERVLAGGEQGKRFKRFINRSLIYPPGGDEPQGLRSAGRTRPAGPLAAAVQRLALRSARVRDRVSAGGGDRAASYLDTELS